MLIPEAALICRKDKRSAMASHCQLSMHHSPGTPATVTTFPDGSASCRQSQVSSSRLRSFQRVTTDRKSVVQGKSGSVRVDRGGGRAIKKKTTNKRRYTQSSYRM